MTNKKLDYSSASNNPVFYWFLITYIVLLSILVLKVILLDGIVFIPLKSQVIIIFFLRGLEYGYICIANFSEYNDRDVIINISNYFAY